MKEEVWIVREGSRVWAYAHEENARAMHADLEPVRYVLADQPAPTETAPLPCPGPPDCDHPSYVEGVCFFCRRAEPQGALLGPVQDWIRAAIRFRGGTSLPSLIRVGAGSGVPEHETRAVATAMIERGEITLITSGVVK